MAVATVYTVTWTTALTDLVGNALASNHVLTFTTAAAPDTTPPTVVSTNIAHGATNVPTATTDIHAIFSENLSAASVTTGTITISPSVSHVVALDSEDTTKAVLAPTAALAVSTLYTVTWTTTIEDLAGNNLATPNVIQFTTAAAADTTAPTVSSVTPANLATNVAISVDVVIVFSEVIAAASVNSTNFILKKVENAEVIPCSVVLSPSNTVTMSTTGELIYSKQYSVTIKGGATGVQDLIGNDFAADSTTTFTTRAATEAIIYNVSNNGNTEEMGSSFDEYIGTQITNTSHPLYNKKINKVKVRARKINSPTGTGEIWVLNSSRNEVYKIGGDYNIANLTSSSSSSTEMTFDDATITTPLAVGQFLVFKYDGGSSSNRIRFMVNESNVISNANMVQIETEGSTPNVQSSWDFAAIIYTYS